MYPKPSFFFLKKKIGMKYFNYLFYILEIRNIVDTLNILNIS